MSNKPTKSFDEWTNEYVRNNLDKLKQMLMDYDNGDQHSPQESEMMDGVAA